MVWTPLGVDPEDFETLVEGVPAWIHAPLKRWLGVLLDNPEGVAVVEDFDLARRAENPLAWTLDTRGFDSFWNDLDDQTTLQLVDFVIHRLGGATHITEDLEKTLSEGGSAWKVGIRGSSAGLERRVPEVVAKAAEKAMQSGDAGAKLAEAWGLAFGFKPKPSAAYSAAIKAIEEAAIPVIQPKHGKATLGTVIGQMKGDGDWKLPIDGSSGQTVVALCSELWNGQTDRHGSNGPTPPTQEAAEAAVVVAVSLIQWFTSGAVERRRPSQ